MASGQGSWTAQLAFATLETAVAGEGAVCDAIAVRSPDSAKRAAPKRNLGHLPDRLWRSEEVTEPKHTVCPCGCTGLVKIGEDRSARLDIIPARLAGGRHDPPHLRLPPLRLRRVAGGSTRPVVRRWAANRGRLGPHRHLQIRRSLGAVSPVTDRSTSSDQPGSSRKRPAPRCWTRRRARPRPVISGH
jgi:hypothetical protein